MKKQPFLSFVIALFVFGAAPMAHAQISLGIRGGISLNNLAIDPLIAGESDPEMILGYQFAVPVEIAIGKVFAVQPEIMFGSHGAERFLKSSFVLGGLTSVTEINNEYRVNTLEIPILAKLKFGSESVKVHVLAGPSFGFGLSGKSKVTGQNTITSSNGVILEQQNSNETYTAKFVQDGYDISEVNQEDEFAVTTTNLSLHLGAGLGFSVGRATLFLDARYMLGLSDVAPEYEGQDKTTAVEMKSNRIGLSAGLMFPLN